MYVVTWKKSLETADPLQIHFRTGLGSVPLRHKKKDSLHLGHSFLHRLPGKELQRVLGSRP